MRHAIGALVALVLLASSACAGQLPDGPTGKKSETELASEVLDRGLQAHTQGRLDEAARAYRETLVHDPQNKYAYYNLGLIEQSSGHVEAAESQYRLALQADPNYVPALFNLAILKMVSAPAEAADLYRRVIAVQPENAGAHLNLGFALRAMGKDDEANAEFERAVELDPSLAERTTPRPSLTPTR